MTANAPDMHLPAPQARELLHTRHLAFKGYRREDGLWDIEGQLIDFKNDVFVIPNERSWSPGEPIHDMSIRVTIDDALVVQDIAVVMAGAPHPECPQAQAPMKSMIGASMAAGWRRSIEMNLGKVKGCAHLRELLFNMATAAYQTVSPELNSRLVDRAPPHLGQCLAWDASGHVVQRLQPVFYLQKGDHP